MTFFTADDFNVADFLQYLGNPRITCASAAYIANQKLQREASVVYGRAWQAGTTVWTLGDDLRGVTHRALLICVEKIERKPCEHEAKIMVGTDNCYVNECIHCGKEIKPTGWEVVDEQR